MKISESNVNLVQQAYGKEVEAAKPPEVNKEEANVDAVQKSGDTVSLSQDARDIQLAKDAVEEAPEVREEVVQDLKKEVDNGSYKVDSNQVADKMVGANIDEIV